MRILYPIALTVKDRGALNSFKLWFHNVPELHFLANYNEKRILFHLGNKTTSPTPGLLKRYSLNSKAINNWLREKGVEYDMVLTFLGIEDSQGFFHIVYVGNE